MPPAIGLLAPVGAVFGISGLQLGLGLLATAAEFGLSYYQAQKAKQAAKNAASQDIQQNIRQSAFPRYVVLGKGRVGGVVWFFEASEKYLYIATILSDDIIDGIDTFYVNNIECLVDANFYVTTPPFNSASTKFVRFELHYGYTDQVVSPILLAAFPSVITADHTASGIAYLVTQLYQPPQADFQRVFNSTVPPIAALVRGVLAYDPRDVAQDPAVADTWTTTTNPALLLLYYFSARNGMGLSRSLFDGDLFSAVADFCDELIATKSDGLRKRYEMGGVYSYDSDPVDIIDEILKTFGGRVFVTSSGLFGLSCDELDTPEITITADMVIELEAKRNTGALYEYSTIKSRFTSEHHGFVELNEEADPWVDADTAARIGREIPFSFDLPYVFRHDQARRLMKQKFYDLNPEWSLDLVLDFNGLELFGERVCRFIYPALGIDGTFRVESVSPDDGAGLAKIHVKAYSIDPAAFAWDAVTEEGTAPAIAPDTSESSAPQTPTGLSSLVGDTGGNIRALLTWTASTVGHSQEAQWKDTAGSVWTTLSVSATDRSVTIPGLTGGVNYDFRVRVTNTRYGVSNWATISFNATAIVGTTGALQSLTGADGVLSVTGTAQQATNAAAAFVEFTAVAHGAGVSWTGSVTIAARASATVSQALTVAAGSWDIYARSVGINGDTGAVSGPVQKTSSQQIDTGGSGGTGGGGGGNGQNDGGSGTGSGGSESPSQSGGIY